MNIQRTVAGIAALSLAGAAAADAPGGEALRQGWYVAPMVTLMSADSARCNVDNGIGGTVALGHRGDFASLEVWGQFLSLSHGSCTYTVPAPTMTDPAARATVVEPGGTVGLNGAGLGLVLGPFFEDQVLARLFGIVGFGVLARKNHPHYGNDTTMFGDVGLGYLHPLELFGLETSVRMELRYRYDVQQPPHPDDHNPAPPHNYQDVIFNAGLQFALSPKPAPLPEPAAEPVAMVPVADADQDGVLDERDQCPDTPAGNPVNDVGCTPTPAPEPTPGPVTLETAQAGQTVVLSGVNFEFNRAILQSNARTILDEVAKQLLARSELVIEVGGHTDSKGGDLYNQVLSRQRAESVRQYLIEQGVGAERMTAAGYGEAQPVDSNDTDEGRERNRRVELKVLE